MIAAAAEALRETLGAFRLSPVYETAPLGVTDQGSFLNAAACGLFPLEAAGGGRADTPPDRLVSAAGELLRLVQGIEARYGRDRAAERRWGERSLDIDILLLGNAVIREPDLTVPHPRLAERAFALRPLLDLLPDAAEPGTGRVYRSYLEAITDQRIRRQGEGEGTS